MVPSITLVGRDTQQDRISFAIQEILKVLAESNMQELDTSSKVPNQTTPASKKASSTSVPFPKSKYDKELPPKLKKDLESLNILAICDPFWRTKYSYSTTINKKPPFLIGDKAMNFETWIGHICRYLINSSKGPFKLLFHACIGAVRTQENLGLFLLPHLMFDILLFNGFSVKIGNENGGDTTATDNNEDVQSNILKEFYYILNNQSDGTITKDGEKLANQTIFKFSDTIRRWHTDSLKDFAKPVSNGSSGADKRAQAQNYNNLCSLW